MNFVKILLFLFFVQLSSYAQIWNSYTTANGLIDNQIRCITGDSTGTIWIGTKSKGIQGFNGSSFITFPKNANLPQSGGSHYEITALQVIESKLYIGVKTTALNGGLWIYDLKTGSLTEKGTFDILNAMDIKVFYKAKNGTVYSGTGNGFYKRNTESSWTKIASGWCQSISEKSDGTIYFTTYDSLYTYDGVSKKGIRKGMFYSVIFDNNDVGYVSESSEIYKFVDTTFESMNFGANAKSMILDKNGAIFMAGSLGLRVIKGTNVYTYNSAPLISNDLTSVFANIDNMKIIGSYYSGLNTFVDNAVVNPVQISPLTANVLIGASKNFTASFGVKPYKWGVIPSDLGTIDTSGQTGVFHATKAGTGKIFVVSNNLTDTAFAVINIFDTVVVPKLPPTSFVVSKGKYEDKVTLSWVEPGEYRFGFEDGIPADWKVNPTEGQPTSWFSSTFIPKEGLNCVKFDVYAPGSPVEDWLISSKIHVSPEKPTLKFYLRTAYAFGNPHKSYVKVSTTNQDITSFTTTVREFDPAYLADSNLVWRPVQIDLSSYSNQDIYIAFHCKAEDIIVYLDDFQMTGTQTGLNSVAKAVRKYRLYKSESPSNIQVPGNVILDSLKTSYTDLSVTPLKNYYYAVSAVYDSNYESSLTNVTYGIAYKQSDSLIIATNSTVAPDVNGVIDSAEYAGAVKSIIANNGYFGDLYLKLVNTKLYGAVDMFSDSTLDVDDYLLIAFDKDRNFGYDSTEGYFRIRKNETNKELAFFPYSDMGFSFGFLNPAGLRGAVELTNNHVQYEFSIDLVSSALNPKQQVFGIYFYGIDAKDGKSSAWLQNLIAAEYSVTKFGSITLPGLVDVKDNMNNVPQVFTLSQNYPNPFNPSTKINYSIPGNSSLKIELFNLVGEKIATLFDQEQNAGNYSFNFDSNKYGLSSGVYFYKVSGFNKETNQGFEKTMKMVLMK